MGREVKRVPIGFEWPANAVWWGYRLPPVPCQACHGTGWAHRSITKGFRRDDGVWHTWTSVTCPVCDGEGNVSPRVEVPEGPGYQLWETVSEGSPLSPALATPEELALWLTEHETSACGPITLSYDQWLAFIQGPGWAPSMVLDGQKFISGVEAAIT